MRKDEFYNQLEEDEKLGLISLITGILGIVGGFLSAIICGYVHLAKVKKSGGTVPGKGMATAGLILGYICAGLLVIVFIAIFLEGSGV